MVQKKVKISVGMSFLPIKEGMSIRAELCGIFNQSRTVSDIQSEQNCVGCSIRAELYKLNVYSTGGHFKAHVDTPRSKEMFGSLVVFLPSVFTDQFPSFSVVQCKFFLTLEQFIRNV